MKTKSVNKRIRELKNDINNLTRENQIPPLRNRLTRIMSELKLNQFSIDKFWTPEALLIGQKLQRLMKELDNKSNNIELTKA